MTEHWKGLQSITLIDGVTGEVLFYGERKKDTITMSEFILKYCSYCNQMTNHNEKGVCQKCQRR